MNLAAIPASVAASALFGHERGAFTGAVEDRRGYFERASGGTLFLDEIGEGPVEVQVMLLRVLETGIIQRVGGDAELNVDVRLISATDADLELAVKSDRFRAALFHRLAGYELSVPALRERKADFGRLFARFVTEELERLGAREKLAEGGDAEPWIPASLVAQLARCAWPGNVRQLRNVVRQLIISNLDAPVLALDRSLERLLAESAVSASAPPPAPVQKEQAAERRRPGDVGEEELVEALRKNRFRLDATAQELCISRTSLYALIDKSSTLRKAKDVPDEELERAHRELGGDVDAMAERLEVSARGLKLRLRELHSGR